MRVNRRSQQLKHGTSANLSKNKNIQTVSDAEKQGFCRPLTSKEVQQKDNVHYIQTFCVHQPHKPVSHEYRLVFGAHQKLGPDNENRSLNDCLHVGPSYLSEVPQLIIGIQQAHSELA